MSERRPPSLDPDELAAVRRPVARASTLPGAPYHASEILAAEMEEIFGRMWICAGHGASVPEPGDLLLREIAGESVIVVRGRDGGLRAFHNVCRHRGTRLLDGEDLADRRADADTTAVARGDVTAPRSHDHGYVTEVEVTGGGGPCARAQKRLRFRACRPGCSSPLEESVWDFDRWYVERMGDRLLAAGRKAEAERSGHDGGQGAGEATTVTTEAAPAAERERGTGEGASGEARP